MLFSPTNISECVREWDDLEKGYQEMQDTHRLYKQKLEEVTKLQNSCSSAIARQRKKLKELTLSLKACKENQESKLSPKEKDSVAEIEESIKDKTNAFFEMEAFLPKKNGLYLNLVLGNINVTLLNKQAKFAYKDEYEKFKLVLTVILFVFSFMCRFFVQLQSPGRPIQFPVGVVLLHTHHPGEYPHQQRLKDQSFVQFLQYYYQSGCLYRLRALGERHNMDLTVEGFQSWMWRGLSFLLPFLFFGHFWQLYNSITLFKMFQLPECKEWQVLMCGCSYMVLFMGNLYTTLRVVYQKYMNNQDKSKLL
uniref:Transmembrane protein 120A n=1 Tax=Nothobranchius pienaari TaxID=704102 RepID=A0A1A8MAQ7_9TELE